MSKVSVVIPAYNEEKYIEKCLDSLMQQTVSPAEIIVVNNNSKDKTVELTKKYPVKIVNEKTQGLIPARNRGFNEAKHEIIARTDADSIVPKDWIEKITLTFNSNDIVGLAGPISFFETPNARIKTFIQKIGYFKFAKALLGHDVMNGPNMIITKEAWRKVKNNVNLDDKKVHEDLDISMHISVHGKILFINDLSVLVSGRRFNSNLKSLLIDYPHRMIKTLLNKPNNLKT